MKKRILAAVIAAVFAVLNVASALPVFALDESTMRYPTPEGYNDHDYQKLVAFLEQTDEDGVKNGEKCSDNYDPNDPETWGSYYNYNQAQYINRFQWIDMDGELRIQRVVVDYRGLCGALDVSGCTALYWLDCDFNNLTELDVSGCTALRDLECFCNNLTSLDVSGFTALKYLSCGDNNLTALDVSGCTALSGLECSNIKELNMYGCTSLWGGGGYVYIPKINSINVEGNGYIRFDNMNNHDIGGVIYAYSSYGAMFLGWYDNEGELISDDCDGLNEDYGCEYDVVIAKFTEAEPIPGDADGDGELTSDDVLLLMRAVMELEELTDDMIAACDINGDGIVNFTDALIMLRMVLNTQPDIVVY